MNRLILKYGRLVTAVILAIFAWVIYRRVANGDQLAPVLITAGIVWLLGVPAFIYFWPHFTVGGYNRAIIKHGLGDGPIPVNRLYAVPTPSSTSASRASLLATGTDDLIYLGGWLDLTKGPQVLHVPEMAGRYYSVQFTDPSTGANFAYVGKRTTGTTAGEYVLSGPDWKGSVPNGVPQILSPNNSVLVVGRVFVENERDRPIAYTLAKQIQLAPLNR